MTHLTLLLFTAAFAAEPSLFKPVDTNFDKNGYYAVAFMNDGFAGARKKASELNKGPLLDRGESHLTVLTPPEFMRMTPDQRAKLLADLKKIDWAKTSIKAKCIGRGTAEVKGQTEAAYFVVVDAPEIAKVREKYGLREFYPHVTLGFTKRDLHAEDGVKKDAKACVQDWPSEKK